MDKILGKLLPLRCYTKSTGLEYDMDCYKLLFCKLAGMGIVFFSCFVKTPQILTILRAKSAKGVSGTSILLELVANFVTLVYSLLKGFTISVWGEVIFLSIQNTFILLLSAYYQKCFQIAFSTMIFSASVIYSFYSFGFLSPVTITWAQATLSLPIILLSKLVQIAENFKAGNTGQLSLITFGLISIGSVVRTVTVAVETSDFLYLLQNIGCAILNMIIVGQIIITKCNNSNRKIKKD